MYFFPFLSLYVFNIKLYKNDFFLIFNNKLNNTTFIIFYKFLLLTIRSLIIVVVGNLNVHNDLVRKVGVGKKVIEIKIKKSLMHFSLTSRHKLKIQELSYSINFY